MKRGITTRVITTRVIETRVITTLVLLMSVTYPAAQSADLDVITQLLQTCRVESSTAPAKSAGRSGYYRIAKTDGRYHIQVDIQLRYPYDYSPQQQLRAVQVFEASKDWIASFYRQYGIEIDIRFEHAPFNPALSNPHPTPREQSFVVYVRPHTGSHMKELYWGVNPEWDSGRQARLIAHEFSHLLQLKDEYLVASGAHSAEEEAGYEDDSLMKNAEHPDPKLYPRHIRKILAPLCQAGATMVAQESTTDLAFSR